MPKAEPIDSRLQILGGLVLILLLTYTLQIVNIALGSSAIVSAVIGVMRYGTIASIGLLARPWPMKVAIAVGSLTLLVLDLLALSGIFSIYDAVAPEPQPFIYFQF